MACAARTSLRILRGAMAVVDRRSGWVLGIAVGLLRCPGLAAVRTGAGSAHHAGRTMVPRGATELRGTCATPRTSGRRCAAVFERAARIDCTLLDGSGQPRTQARDPS